VAPPDLHPLQSAARRLTRSARCCTTHHITTPQGCWQFAGGHGREVFDGLESKLTAVAQAGYTSFDTADIYGASEGACWCGCGRGRVYLPCAPPQVPAHEEHSPTVHLHMPQPLSTPRHRTAQASWASFRAPGRRPTTRPCSCSPSTWPAASSGSGTRGILSYTCSNLSNTLTQVCPEHFQRARHTCKCGGVHQKVHGQPAGVVC
jgi:hypothetical protein